MPARSAATPVDRQASVARWVTSSCATVSRTSAKAVIRRAAIRSVAIHLAMILLEMADLGMIRSGAIPLKIHSVATRLLIRLGVIPLVMIPQVPARPSL